MDDEGPSVESLIVQSERILDSVLLEQLRKINAQQANLIQQIIEVYA